MRAASATVLAIACGGNGTGPSQGVTRAALLAIGRDTAAEPSGTLCSFKNNLLSHCRITHSDSVHTVLADFSFFPHSVVSRNDTLLADTSTIVLTLTVSPGSYEFTISPAGLVFNQSNEPIVDVSFGSYGDPSVYTQSSKYASVSAFIQALGVWHERTADHWFLGRNSTLTGPSTVSSAIEGPGTYLLAAPK
jgi:hypothetical protein